MYSGLKVFRMAFGLAEHAAARQAVIARNVANADTPGFKARDIRPFSDMVKADPANRGMRFTRAGHLNIEEQTGHIVANTASGGATDPNDNSVSVELEMLKAVDAKRQHDRAIAIYRSSMNVLRASLGKV